MGAYHENDIGKNRFIRNLLKDSGLIIIITLIILSWTIIYLLFFYQPSYKSNAKIWIKDLNTEAFVADIDNNRSQLTPLTAAGNPLLTQLEILKSNQLKKYLENYIRLNFQKNSKKSKISADKTIEAKTKVGTDIITITLTWNNPEQAKKLLEVVLEEYDNINLQINRKIKTSRRKYIDVKLAEIESKLLEVRNKIRVYRKANLAINLEEESNKLVDQKMDLTTKLEETTANLNSTRSAINQLEKQLSLKPNEAINSVALGSGNQNLVKLRSALDEAVQQYEFDTVKMSDSNPKMIAQKNKINTIKQQIKAQIKLSLGKYSNNQKMNIFDPVREKMVENLITAQTNFIGQQSEQDSLNDSINKINTLQTQYPEKKFNMDNLEQEERALSKAFDELREKQIEARIKEAEAVSNVVVIDAPELPLGGSFPSRTQVIILSLILGLGFGFASSVLKTILEDVCDDPELIEHITRSSIIGSIPWIDYVDPANSNEQYQFIYNIAYNNILSNLLIRCYKRNAKVITFTSTSLKKPISPVLYQLACGLKKQGHSVAVIDSDFRIPTIAKEARVDDKIKVNLSELIVFIENKIRKKTEIESGYVLNALVEDENGIAHLGNNEIVLEPYEFFGTTAFEFIVDILKINYDWVLIDTAAPHITPEFLMIARLTDGVIMLANKTITYSTLRNVSKSLKDADIDIIGTIVREFGSRLEREYERYLQHQEDQFFMSNEIMNLEWGEDGFYTKEN